MTMIQPLPLVGDAQCGFVYQSSWCVWQKNAAAPCTHYTNIRPADALRLIGQLFHTEPLSPSVRASLDAWWACTLVLTALYRRDVSREVAAWAFAKQVSAVSARNWLEFNVRSTRLKWFRNGLHSLSSSSSIIEDVYACRHTAEMDDRLTLILGSANSVIRFSGRFRNVYKRAKDNV